MKVAHRLRLRARLGRAFQTIVLLKSITLHHAYVALSSMGENGLVTVHQSFAGPDLEAVKTMFSVRSDRSLSLPYQAGVGVCFQERHACDQILSQEVTVHSVTHTHTLDLRARTCSGPKQLT